LEVAPVYFRRILIFACNTGMRINEILTLKFKQIKFLLTGCEVKLVDTKSGEKEYVTINEDVLDTISEIASERKINLKNLSDREKEKHVFTVIRGQQIKSVRKPLENTFKSTGIKLRPFHTFRHFWTKMMFDSGVDPYTIQKVDRWRDFRTMLKYCYSTRPEEHEAVNRLSTKLKTRPQFLKWQYSDTGTQNHQIK
jgi:integrase